MQQSVAVLVRTIIYHLHFYIHTRSTTHIQNYKDYASCQACKKSQQVIRLNKELNSNYHKLHFFSLEYYKVYQKKCHGIRSSS